MAISPTLIPGLAEYNLIESRTYNTTVYTAARRKWVDADGNVTNEEDAPQAQLQVDEFPELKAARDTFLALVEKAAAWKLGYTADPGQQYVPPAVII